jgi:hypothetical protein
MRTATLTRPGTASTPATIPSVKSAALQAAAIATAANVAIWLAGRAAGVTFAVPDFRTGAFTTLGLPQILISTVMPILAGAALWAAMARRPAGPQIVRIAAVAVTVLSLGGPLGLPVAATTRVLLAAMHLVAGAVFLRVVARPPAATAPQSGD